MKIGDLNDGVITAAEETINERGLVNSAAKLLPPGVLLIAMYGSIGKLGITGIECATNQAIAHCRPVQHVELHFLFWLLRSRREELLSRGKGGAQQNISQTVLRAFEVLVPPVAEQKRIVAKVEELLACLNSAREQLARVLAILKRFRDAVLTAACEGRLTGNDMSTWVGTTLGRAAREITVGHVGPMANEYVVRGVPFLRSQNVREFRFDAKGLKFISKEFHLRLRKTILRPGDIAVVRSGNSGVACVIPPELKEANCADLVVIRPSARLNPAFAAIFLNSVASRTHIEDVKVGIAQGHFNIGSAREMPIRLPPLAEQVETARRVEVLFEFADAIEKRVAAVTARADKLTQAILAKAFRGELVPTEAELAQREGRAYEPAAVLLGRIRQGAGVVRSSELMPVKLTRRRSTQGIAQPGRRKRRGRGRNDAPRRPLTPA